MIDPNELTHVQLAFCIKYMLSTMLDVEGSQLAFPAASASRHGDMGPLAYLMLLKAAMSLNRKQ